MNADYIEENHVIERYLLKQLSDEEQVAFELYYMEHPETLEEIELARAMKTGLEGALTENATSENRVAKAPTSTLLQTVSGWFQNPALLVANFGVMAVLLVLVFLPSGPGAEQPALSAQRVWIGETRGGAEEIDIDVINERLILDIDVSNDGSHLVSLEGADGKSAVTISDAMAEANALMVILDPSALEPGEYTLRVVNSANRLEVERRLAINRP